MAEKYVICRGGKGRMVEHGVAHKFFSNFPKDSVGVVRDVGAHESMVYVIGQGADYMFPNGSLKAIDPAKTGVGHRKKICDICHVLKAHSEFARNQTQEGRRIVRHRSCRACRKNIDKKSMLSAAEKKAAEKLRPKEGALFRCPICRKQTIVGVTAKIVLGHRHGDGSEREFICDSCNTGLGRFNNGNDYLQNAIDYLNLLKR